MYVANLARLRADIAIAASVNGCDQPRTQRFAQRRDVDLERVVLDDVFIEGEAALSLVRAVEGNARICTVSTTAACLIPTTTERRLQEATKRNSKIMRNVASSRATLQLLPKALYASVKRQLRSGSETV